MDIEKRSLKYVEYHMFETFDPIFLKHNQAMGFWHDHDGLPRYESLLENGISVLFPHFDPDSDKYDTYEFQP